MSNNYKGKFRDRLRGIGNDSKKTEIIRKNQRSFTTNTIYRIKKSEDLKDNAVLPKNSDTSSEIKSINNSYEEQLSSSESSIEISKSNISDNSDSKVTSAPLFYRFGVPKIDVNLDVVDTKKTESDISDNNNFQEIGVSKVVENTGVEVSETDKYLRKVQDKRDFIFKKIKNKLKKDLNELEVIESEIYLLNDCHIDSGVSEEIEENRKKFLNLVRKAQKIKEQFNIFKVNSYLEDIIWLDDSNLIDDIAEYKSLVSASEDLEIVKDDLELVDEYKALFLEITTLEEHNKSLDLKSQKKLLELQAKDREYDAYKLYCDSFNDVADQMNKFLIKQDEAMEKFSSQIGIISSQEIISYQMKNLDKLLYFNAKYFFGLMLSPFKGLFPSLAFNAVATKKMIDNINKTVHLEEIRKTIYKAEDYSNELDYTLYSLNDVGNTLDENINKLRSLEEDIKIKFHGYNSFKLNRILKQISKMRKILDNNRYKLEKVKDSCYGHIKENERVLTKVRRLNEN